jgi:germination protein M
MKHQPWIRSAAIAGAIALLTTGCSILGSGSNQIDPPPQAGAEADVLATSGAVTINMAESSQMTIFAKDAKGFVAPISLGLPKTQSVARTTLEYMVAGGPVSSLLPSGFQALLPAGTKIKGVNIMAEKKLAVVDFSKEFLNYNEQDERKILEAITWTLTSFPTVEKVQLWVDGRSLTEMPKGKTPLDEPMGRMMGINIEKSEDAEFGQSTPVTLYFVNQNDQNYKYYVPVTRMVKRTNDIAAAVVEQLIKGPDQKKGLTSVMNATTELRSVKMADNLLTVDVSSAVLGPDQKASAESLQSMILSLTENTGLSQVQIMVDGNVKVTSTDEQNYSKPVTRPTHINPVKL